MFAHVLESKKKVALHEMLGLESEEVGKWAHELTNAVAKNLNDELKDQIIKNLVFLLQHSEVDSTALYQRLAHLGRKAMNDIRTAKPHLGAILLLFSVSIQVLLEQGKLQAACPHILSLTIRIATDEQYGREDTVQLRQAADEVHHSMQQALGAMPYLESYQTAQK